MTRRRCRPSAIRAEAEAGAAVLGKVAPVVVLVAVAIKALQHAATSVHRAIRAVLLAIIPKADQMALAAPVANKVQAEAVDPVVPVAVHRPSL